MAAAGVGNPAGAVPIYDGGNPRIVGGLARNAIISGGVFCFASGAASVVSSGANSVVLGDLLFAGDASGTQFNGICMQTTAVSGAVAVATRGAFLLVCNGTVVPGEKVKCDGENSVQPLGSTADVVAKGPSLAIGRALTQGASGGYALIDIHG